MVAKLGIYLPVDLPYLLLKLWREKNNIISRWMDKNG
jgi:hypothetical protein